MKDILKKILIEWAEEMEGAVDKFDKNLSPKKRHEVMKETIRANINGKLKKADLPICDYEYLAFQIDDILKSITFSN